MRPPSERHSSNGSSLTDVEMAVGYDDYDGHDSLYLEKTKTQQNENDDPPPDGGVTAWTHVLLLFIVFFNTWGIANGWGVFQSYYSQTLKDQSRTNISWIGSFQVFFLFSVGTVAGRLTDQGYFRPVFGLGVLLQLVGIFMTSLARTYAQIILAQGVCVGLGNGCTFCPALALLSQYFKKHRAFAVGIGASGAAVGGLVYPVMIQWLTFYDHAGFPWAIRSAGFVMLATYVPCLILFKPRLPPRSTGPWIDMSAFREAPFVFFTISMFLNFWGLYFAFFYMGTYARDIIGITRSINLLMILNGVGVIGRLTPGIIADKWTGSLNLLIPISLATSMLCYCWAAINSAAGLYVFVVFYGLLAAALQALFPGVATTMTPHPSKAGTRIGMILSIVSVANLTGPAICGWIISDERGGYLGAQMFAGTSIFLGALAAIGARIAKTGWVLRAKV